LLNAGLSALSRRYAKAASSTSDLEMELYPKKRKNMAALFVPP